MSKKVNIFQFQDYRQLLLHLIEQRKKDGKIFTYRWFSQKAGLSSPNFLNLVVKGKRHLSAESVEKVISIFQFTKEEGDFFRHLVQFNKAKTLSEKEHFAQQLVKLKKFQSEFPLSKDQFEYFAKWYHIPVRELLTLPSPPQTEEEISQMLTPSISKQEAQDALQKLLDLGLIEKRDGKWIASQESITTGHNFSNYGVVRYHKKMMEFAAESLDTFPGQEREISSVVIGLSEENFKRGKKLIEELRSQLMAMSLEDVQKDRLYQICFQLFPLSKKRGAAQ